MIKIIGVDKLLKNIRTLKHKIPGILESVSNKQVRVIDNIAMKNLYSTTTSGPSQTGDSIDKKVKIEGGFDSAYQYKINLEYYSKHAEIVELGGAGKVIYAKDYGYEVWPIGQSQLGRGNEGVFFSPTFTLQPGKHYLGNAVFQHTQGYAGDMGFLGKAYKSEIIKTIGIMGV